MPSQWDATALAFVGDVLPGNHIEVSLFPATAFDVIGPHTVPKIAHTDAALAAIVGLDVLLPFANGAANTEAISTRCMVRVPPCLRPVGVRFKSDTTRALESNGRRHTYRRKSCQLRCPLELDYERVAL